MNHAFLIKTAIAVILTAALGRETVAGAAGDAATPPRPWSFSRYPKETVPPLTEKLRAEFAARPIASARRVVAANGMPLVEINGERMPLDTYFTMSRVPRDGLWVSTIRDVGCPIITAHYNISKHWPERGWPDRYARNSRHFFRGWGRYDATSIEPWLWRYLRVHPTARIMIWTNIDDYPGFPDAYPDQLMRSEQGDKFMCINHFTCMESDLDKLPENRRDDPRIRPVWSFFSEIFLTQMEDAMAEYVRRVEDTLPGSRAVIGYWIGGAADNQMYNWHDGGWKSVGKPHKWGDYSKPARRAWKEWTADRYGAVDKVNAAWGTDYASFEDVDPPPSTLLAGFDRLLFDPEQHRQAVDYRRFMSEGRNRVILRLARAVKEASETDLLVGTFGTPHHGGRMDATANDQLLRSPYIDALCSQSTYGQSNRQVPGPGGVNAALMAHVVNDKIFVVDNDYPTWLAWDSRHEASYDVDMPTFRAQMRREMARLWTRGSGTGFHSLRWPWVYNDPQIKAEMARLYRWSPQFADPYLENTAREIAVIYDETATDFGARPNFHHTWTAVALTELNLSGVPYRLYYGDDFRDGKVPAARTYIFLNPFRLDPAFMKQLERIRGNGITTVFLQGAGYESSDMDLASQAVGMDVAPLDAVSGTAEPGQGKDPLDSVLTEGLPILPEGPIRYPMFHRERYSHWGDIYAFKPGYTLHPFAPAARRVVDDEAQHLAWYPGTDKCGLAVREHEDWTAVFVGAYALSRRFYHNIARYSGAWAAVPPDNVFCANDEIVMLHPLHSGEVKITLEKPSPLRELPPANGDSLIDLSIGHTHTLAVEAGKTYLFERRRSR